MINPKGYTNGGSFKQGHVPWNKGKNHLGKGETHPSWKGGKGIMVCKNCLGNFLGYKSQKRVFCSYECRDIHHSKTLRGENHPNWVVDRTQLAEKKNGNEYRNSPKSREWGRNVKCRDGWKCKISNNDCSGRLEAHHILSWKEHPKLRYSLNNGITLCHFHHPRVREEEKRLSPYFQDLVSASK